MTDFFKKRTDMLKYPSKEELRKLFTYRQSTGDLIWKQVKGKEKVANSVAGWVTDLGYHMIKINNVGYSTHRLIWIYHNDEILSDCKEIDHIDHNKSNNKIENLRVVTSSQNSKNRSKSVNRSSQYKGVSFKKSHRKWVARIETDNGSLFLGHFKTEQEAAEAYNKTAIVEFGEYANLNILLPVGTERK